MRMEPMKKIKINLRFKSIRSKLLVSLIGICLIPMVALGMTAYIDSNLMLKDNLESSSSQMLREVNRGIDKELIALGNNISMLSNNINFISIISNPEFSPYLIDSLKGVQENNKTLLSVYMGTSTKAFYEYPKNGVDASFDPTSRPWYKKAIENKGKVIFTDPYKDVNTEEIAVTIAKTVEKNGEIVGVVAVDVNFAELSRSLSEIKIGNKGYAMLLDNSGMILAHPNAKLVGTDTFSKLPVWNEVNEKGEGFSNYEYEGVQKFAAYTHSPVTEWTVLGAMEASELSDDTRSILVTLIAFLVIIGAIAIVLSIIITRSLTVNIKKIKDVMTKASMGDLTETIDIKSIDEIGALAKSFNIMLHNISNILRSVESSSQTVLETSSNLTAMTEETSASISEVSRAIGEISQGATEQASSTQEAASQMEELASGLDVIAASTNEMKEVSANTKTLSNKGLGMVKLLMKKSAETKETTQAVAGIVEDMSRSTEDINKISDTISQITAQTNLLSLNASIEAARAGEAGRGFAVVADEIRKLAEQSKASTEEIKRIVEDIQGKSTTAVQAMEQAKSIVSDQDTAVEETNVIFNDIYSSINSLITMVGSVKEHVLNINGQKEEVIGQIESISAVSQEAASSSEEVSASTEEITATMDEYTKYVMELQNLSEKLSEELGKFKIK
jgi:methyl-accepting chemotaxis protein